MSEKVEMIRTPEEILAQVKIISPEDIFGWQRGPLLAVLPFEHAKPFLIDGLTEKDYIQDMDPAHNAVEYLPFAWDKADSERGISANRSIEHFIGWAWLLDEDFYQKLRKSYEEDYSDYGKKQLILISEHFGYDWSEYKEKPATEVA